MKRIAALKSLSMDHHHGLVLAREAKAAAKTESDVLEQQRIWSKLEAHAVTVLESHFKIEETLLASALSALKDPHIITILERMYKEHAALRTLLSFGSPRTTAQLIQVSELLALHIRFEERELFELAQTRLDQQVLDAIAQATHHD
ncbi:MAG: hemerythrin domain-containing protein [Nitrosomonas sp.]|nr:hemerythrin domain-containing protein [Nitrosomonas sp.]